MMAFSPSSWLLFGGLVVAMLALDLGWQAARRVPDREGQAQPRAMPLRAAALWSVAWIGLALTFGVIVLALYGREAALTYVTAFLLEKSLSVDNLFVFLLIFETLAIPAAYERTVLSWGVLGALVMRAVLIAAGIYTLDRLSWVTYLFGLLILFAAARIIWGQEKQRQLVQKSCSVCESWVARIIPITPVLHGSRFVIRQNGRFVATPLLVALVVIETTDLVFALDSVPAVLSITREPFLVYTSNVFALLGLRSLYFLLAAAVARLQYIRAALAVILAFVGLKMLLARVVDIPVWVALAVIAIALGGATIASAFGKRQDVTLPPGERAGMGEEAPTPKGT